MAAAIAVAAAAGAALGRRAGFATALALAGATVLLHVILPRAAHRAFRHGSFGRAAFLYGLLRHLRLGRDVRAALEVSVAACLLGRERYRDGLAVLDRVDQAALGDSARAAWLNNRAYALVRNGTDAAQALADIERAIDLRPDLSGFRHTRGLALLALGRVDDAIRDLDAVWRRQEPNEDQPLLEAERCYDLGLAWVRKGERDYAADYFDRARRAAPDSVWASRALAEMAPTATIPDAIADLV